MPGDPLVILSDGGLFCPRGGFHVDAWKPVDRNVITHAHSDHARAGSKRYLTARDGGAVLRHRLGPDAAIDSLEYGQKLTLNDVTVSLHPAGHILGSCQVRIESGGEVWVISGDYKRQPDPTCRPFELVPCHTFITETTFGLPVFRWGEVHQVMDEIHQWWRANQALGRTSIVLAYSLGKAQRVLAGLDADAGPILLHGAVHAMTEVYRESGVTLPPAEHASVENARRHRGRALVIAPPSALNSTWSRKFAPVSTAIASGWMRIRGPRRRRAVDRGFVLSDHADFPSLLSTVDETGAQQIIATHGFCESIVRLMHERGRDASSYETRFNGEEEEALPAANDLEALPQIPVGEAP